MNFRSIICKEFDESSKKYRVLSTKELNNGQKVAFLRDPDYAFVTTAESISILLFELESFLIKGGVYISVHNYI